MSQDADILTEIYRDEINLAVWQRSLPETLRDEVSSYLSSRSLNHCSAIIPAADVASTRQLRREFGDYPALYEDIQQLIDMFTCLFELNAAGLRVTPLTKAMCPKFHVDHVPCRLITTYQGPATQWLAHDSVQREKLGAGSRGLSDDASGLYPCASHIQQLCNGDVALLKGERWQGNEGGGLVHRSPAIEDDPGRLLLTLDFA